jgi:hypothetical protein
MFLLLLTLVGDGTNRCSAGGSLAAVEYSSCRPLLLKLNDDDDNDAVAVVGDFVGDLPVASSPGGSTVRGCGARSEIEDAGDWDGDDVSTWSLCSFWPLPSSSLSDLPWCDDRNDDLDD